MSNIIAKLKKAAAKESTENQALNYRTAFGPFKVKDQVFESNRFYFDPANLHATSYGWWSMLTVLKGKLVRNNCGYSMQTSVHQGMLDKAMRALRIKADITVSTKANIGDVSNWRATEIETIAQAMYGLERARKNNKKNYKLYANRLRKDFDALVKAGIFKKLTTKELNAAIASVKASHAKELEWKRERKAREKARQSERDNELVEVFINYGGDKRSEGVMTRAEYKEWTLTACTGDYHMHSVEPANPETTKHLQLVSNQGINT